jgi:hypothetical protein
MKFRRPGLRWFSRRLGSHVVRNAVAYTLLFVLLAGTASAVATIGASDIKKNAVRSRHIKDGQVKTPDLADDAVTANKIADGAALAGEVIYIKGPDTSIPADGQTHLLAAICPSGTNVVGGGVLGSFLFRVAQSYPSAANGSDPGRQGWTVRVQNTFSGGGAASGNAVATCVRGAQASGTWP